MDIIFSSLQELYERLKPALYTKKQEMIRAGFEYIKEEDIWNYLKEIKWKRSIDLSLHEMVDDVINCDNYAIDKYLKSKLNLQDRRVYFETTE